MKQPVDRVCLLNGLRPAASEVRLDYALIDTGARRAEWRILLLDSRRPR